ncbi:Syntaxin-2 [Nibea albiflora]|uniref:Syntaxin-2 n=1 Tax=Nibea albiflora TaxID=240163 RepID=A0ACB7FCP4_NIBAL|nr:Syntaxin-2 [Nibea albiflora]
MRQTAENTANMEDFFQTVNLTELIACASTCHVLRWLNNANVNVCVQVGEVRSLIEHISCQAEEVEKRHGAILATPNQDKSNKDALELLNSETKKNANLVRAKLKSMQKDFPVDENSNSPSVIQRIQKNQHSHLTRWFAEVMRGYHKAQISFREKCKAQIQRQLEIVDKVTTDEELEEMLHRDNLAIFISDINSGARISSQALSEIESRHQDIICLESSIKELHEIFADTAMLLEIQGELINNIEKNVTSAAEYVDISKAETHKAVTFKKNRYKVASLPSFLKRKTSAKTATDQNTSDLSHD